MFNIIIGRSKNRNIMRIAETMPSLLDSDPSIDATTKMRIKSMQDEVKRRSEERQKLWKEEKQE